MDEADRLLEVGFKEEVDMIVRHCPKERTTMLFSATMTGEWSAAPWNSAGACCPCGVLISIAKTDESSCRSPYRSDVSSA